MGWLSKKPKNRFIAIISKLDEKTPLKNEIVYCSETKSLLQAKTRLMSRIGAKVQPRLCYVHNGKTLEGEKALKAIGETIIPSDSFVTKDQRDQYYEDFTYIQVSFYALDVHESRTVYALCIVRKDDD